MKAQNPNDQSIPAGTVIDPSICNGWVDPQGRLYFVPGWAFGWDHDRTARESLGFDGGADEAERRGWIHLSLFLKGYVIIDERHTCTGAQVDLFFDLFNIASEANPNDPGVSQMRRAIIQFFEMNQIEIAF